MSSAAAFTFDGTDDARGFQSTLPCCLTEVHRRLLVLCLLVTALVSILRANDSVRSVGLSSALHVFRFANRFHIDGTDDARRLSVYLYRAA
jgi:hypothetical protein